MLLVYGEQDWAPASARKRVHAPITDVVAETIPNAGHFLSLDRPQELQRLIEGFARS